MKILLIILAGDILTAAPFLNPIAPHIGEEKI
jgi:hypothetical protein